MSQFIVRGIIALLGLVFGDILGLPPQAPQVLPEGLPYRFMNSIGMEMQLVPAASFSMGSDEEYKKYGEGVAPYGPVHEVSLDAFYMARFEITREQFEVFARETGRMNDFAVFNRDLRVARRPIEEHPRYPVRSVTWEDAVDYCSWLSEREGRSYRLPTEAEWEYAARGGSEFFPWYGGEVGPYMESFPRREGTFPGASPPGSYRGNPLGFYDMLGNAAEWTRDWYARQYDPFDRKRNPDGPWWGNWLGTHRVKRGSYEAGIPASLSPFSRAPTLPDDRRGGFRLVCEIDEEFIVPEPLISTSGPPPSPNIEPGKIYETWEIVPGIELELVWIPPGKFILGAPEEEADGMSSPQERPITPMIVPEGVFMGVYEVTQEQFAAIMAGDHLDAML